MIVYNPNALADNCSLRVGTNTALFGAPTTPAATLVAPGPASASDVVISGGEVDYSSDDIPVGVTAVNGGQAVCTDPTNAPNGDPRNAWRSTVTDPSTAGTFTTTDADGNPVTITVGAVTEYLNRYGQVIAASEGYTDTYSDQSTSSGTGMGATEFSGNTEETDLGNDDVTSISPSSTQLLVTASDQGTATAQQYDTNGNLTQMEVDDADNGGVPLLAISDDGQNTNLTAAVYNVGTDVVTFPDVVDNSDVQPDAAPSPTAVFNVSEGINTSWQNLLTGLSGSCPSGTYSQPPFGGTGFFEFGDDNSFVSEVTLTPATHATCNNLVTSTLTDSNGTSFPSGSIEIRIANGQPNTQYSVTYTVNAPTGVTGSTTGTPSASADVNIADSQNVKNAIAQASCTGASPIPDGVAASKSGSASDTVTVTTDASGGAHVAYVRFSLFNKGPGTAWAIARVKVTSITLVAGQQAQSSPLGGAGQFAGSTLQPPQDLLSDQDWLTFDPALTGVVTALYSRDGAINRDDMIAILHSAISGGTVSDAALRALDVLATPAAAADLNEPDDVAALTADVVDGNAANADFQGQPLGNLAAQPTPAARATALTDLIGKWFEGSDLPAIPSWASYSVTAGPLFGTAGVPSLADMRQGALGDCYLVAALGAIADRDPSAIENMFIDNGDGTYTVRFYYGQPGAGYTADYVTVNMALPGYGSSTIYARPGADGSWWLPLLEKAYAQWNETGYEGRDGTNSYAALSGGVMGYVDQQVLGCDALTICPTEGAAVDGSTPEQALIAALESGAAVTAAVFGSSDDPTFAALQLVNGHAYEVVGYDADPDSPNFGKFQLENPWGYYDPQPLTWTDLAAYCSWFNLA